MNSRPRIMICGAGIAGISAAYFLSRDGLNDIWLVDERAPLTLTSDRSTECYRNWWPDELMVELMNRSITLMDELAASSSNVFRMNRRGYLYLTGDEVGVSLMHENAEQISRLGGGPLRIHERNKNTYRPSDPEGYINAPPGADLLLGRSLIGGHFPGLSESTLAALHVRRAGWLSAQQLGMHLLEEARSNGIRQRTARVAHVDVRDGRVRSALLADGEKIPCDIFVNAAGPFFKKVGAMMGLDLPVTAEIHLKVAFEDHMRVVQRDSPLLIWTDSQMLPWSKGDRLLFDESPDLGWLVGPFPGGVHTRPEGGPESATILMLWDYRTNVVDPVFPVPLDDMYPEVVLRGLATMIPGLGSYVGRSARPRLDGGYYVRTRENRPLVGPTSVEGGFLIGALSGFGIMSACAAGELLAAHISGSPLPAYAPSLLLRRYADGGYLSRLDQLEPAGDL